MGDACEMKTNPAAGWCDVRMERDLFPLPNEVAGEGSPEGSGYITELFPETLCEGIAVDSVVLVAPPADSKLFMMHLRKGDEILAHVAVNFYRGTVTFRPHCDPEGGFSSVRYSFPPAGIQLFAEAVFPGIVTEKADMPTIIDKGRLGFLAAALRNYWGF